MRKCDSCGKLYQESKDVFCPHCGAVAQKQCTHSSSFDSKRYDRGEIYKNNTQYQNTTYNQGYEPHAQRESYPYNQPENNFGGKKNLGDKIPKINVPDITKTFSGGKSKNGKSIGIIGVCIVIAFNLITGLLSHVDDAEIFSDYEVVSEHLDNNGPFFAFIDKATIEVAEEDGELTGFVLEISGMDFDEYFSEDILDDVSSGAMSEEILSEYTFVEMLICDFNKEIVDEESYNNTINDSYYYSGKQIDGGCKYAFLYDFEYGEIIHIGSGVDFHLNNGRHINAELPFSAFSVSENGEITYYSSYADDGTAWNTVFEECSNQQDTGRDTFIDFGE